MDSLLSNYASSDEEEEQPQQQQHENTASKSSSSKVSSLFSSLPQPKLPISNPKTPLVKQNQQQNTNPTKPTSIFTSLPQPKSQPQQQQKPISNLSNPKKIVQFIPPINLSTIKQTDFDDDDDNEEKQRKKPKESESLTVKSFLSAIPAPKNSSTLGVLPSSGGSGRRSIIETEASVSTSTGFKAEEESGNTQNLKDYVNYDTNYPNYETVVDQNTGNYVNYGSSYETYDQNVSTGDGLSYGSYENYGNYVDYGQYGNNSGDGSVSMVPQTAAVSNSVVRVPGKRGRNEVPIDIVEVKQDELIKDRPREDQVKLTGIAFGPSYQPVSTKGKPSKLHKRKHQIGTLYFDMKQKEMELSERRAKGFLTKAETQAKYGW